MKTSVLFEKTPPNAEAGVQYGVFLQYRQAIATKMVLYRGVNPELHNQTAGELLPKNDRPFVRSPEYGRAEYGNSFWGKCAENAVVEHQLHQAGYPTSGVSTTPHLSRAIFYATQDGKYPNGFVYVIDESQCQIHNVTIHIVKETLIN